MFFVINSPLLKALGWALLHSIWQFALLLLIYMAIKIAFSRSSAAVRHSISLYLLVAGSLVFAGTLCYQYYIFSRGAADAGFSFAAGNEWLRDGSTGVHEWINRYSPYFSLTYLAMIALYFCRLANWFLITHNKPRVSAQKPPVEWRLFVRQKAAQMGIIRKVTLQLSAVIDTPQVIGYLKPVILLPLSCISQLTPLQLEAIIMHELAHIRRNDFFINLFTAIASVVFFFNPFARRLIEQLRDERENACDDWVLQFCYPAREYATALLLLEKNRRSHAALQIAAGGNKKKQLLHRIQRMLQVPHQQRPSVLIWLNLVVISTFLLLFIVPPSKTTTTSDKGLVTQLFTPYFTGTDTETTEKTIVNKTRKPALAAPAKVTAERAPENNPPESAAVTGSEYSPGPAYIVPGIQSVAGDDWAEISIVSEALAQEPVVAFTLPGKSPAAKFPSFNHIDHNVQQPFLPNQILEYYYVIDSAITASKIKQYAEVILKTDIITRPREILKKSPISPVQLEKALSDRLESIREGVMEQQQLYEARKLQYEALEKAYNEQQQQLKLKTGKKRVVHI